MKALEKNARTPCFMHQSIFRHNYIFKNDAYILDFCAEIHFDLLNINPFNIKSPAFGILNYEKQQKKASVKFWEDLLYFQHSMQIFVFAQNQ